MIMNLSLPNDIKHEKNEIIFKRDMQGSKLPKLLTFVNKNYESLALLVNTSVSVIQYGVFHPMGSCRFRCQQSEFRRFKNMEAFLNGKNGARKI